MTVAGSGRFEFGTDEIFGDEDTTIELTPVINHPSNLVPEKSVYVVRRIGGRFSSIEIHAKTKLNFHMDYRRRAERLAPRNPEQAITSLDQAMEFAETPQHKLETLRTKSSLLDQLGRHQEQEAVLAKAVEHLTGAPSDSYRLNYWKERYNAFISWTGYLGFRDPDHEFGLLMMESAPHRIAWRRYVISLSAEGFDSSMANSAEEYTAQLLQIKARFRYP